MTRWKHLLSQGPVVASLGKTALAALRRRGDASGPPPATPGPTIHKTIAPRPPELVRDYLREVGGDAGAWRGAVPPHMFAQWGFPLAARTLADVPYPLLKVMNGGCRLEINGRLPADQPLEVSARLEGVDDDGRRAVLHQVVTTGTAEAPELVVAHLYAIVPLAARGDGAAAGGPSQPTPTPTPTRPKREAVRVPADSRELAYWRLGPDAGLAFAALTGDVNPVHWVRPYARAFGFRSVILHGFATLARTFEGLARHRFAGEVDRIASLDVKFTRPLVLPARVGLYLSAADAQGGVVHVGDAPGGPAYLAGHYTTTPDRTGASA